jgi:predicted dinucleotide-binding enzyme
MNIGILGSGGVGKSLGSGFLAHGHDVMLGTRTPSKLAEWLAQFPSAKVGSFAETAAFGDIVVLAVSGQAAMDALSLAGAANIAGKTIIDTTNPIVEGLPEHGVLKFFTNLDDSLMERLQRGYPEARFVKAFNSVGSAAMVDPDFPGGPPTMFICGNDATAKETVSDILTEFGWDIADMGMASAARAIEPLCILWCIPGFLENDWNHAFKMLYKA